MFRPKYKIEALKDGTYRVECVPGLPGINGGDPNPVVCMTQDQFDRFQGWLGRHGGMIDEVLSDLTPGERESLLSGMVESRFDKMFGDDEEIRR